MADIPSFGKTTGVRPETVKRDLANRYDHQVSHNSATLEYTLEGAHFERTQAEACTPTLEYTLEGAAG